MFVVLAASMICTTDARKLLQFFTGNDVFNNNQGNFPINSGGVQDNNVATTGGRNN